MIDLKKPGQKTYIMKIGSSDPDDDVSNVIKNQVTICGKEKISLIRDEPLMLQYAGDGVVYDPRQIKFAEYSTWFTVGFDDPEASSQCVIEKYELVKEGREEGQFVPVEPMPDVYPTDYMVALLE